MKLSCRILKTNVFRLTLLHTLLMAVLVVLALSAFFVSVRGQINELIDTRLRLETDVLVGLYQSGSMPQLMAAIQQRNQVDDYGRFYFLSTNGEPKANDAITPETQSYTEPPPSSVSASNSPLPLVDTSVHSTKRMADVIDLHPSSPRANIQVRLAETRLGNGTTLLIGHEISKEMNLIQYTLWLLVGVSLFVLGVVIISGVMMGISVLKRLASINRTANHIMEHGDLSRRLTVTQRRDEFDDIATHLNHMLERIEKGMSSMRQISNNVAHDLRSPLTRLRNRLEVTLLEPRDTQEYCEAMGEAIEDADQLISTFNAILSISRLESGLDRSEWLTVDLVELAEQCHELYQPLAEDEEHQLTLEKRCSKALIRGQPNMLSQALTNLLDNAIKYSGQGSNITIVVDSTPEHAILHVKDTGQGIPEADRDRVLDRFVRLESERSTPGNGLGLSLVSAIANIYRAELTLSDNQPGLIASLRIPRNVNLPKRSGTKSLPAILPPASAQAALSNESSQ